MDKGGYDITIESLEESNFKDMPKIPLDFNFFIMKPFSIVKK
jgi:hypothetical protein